MVDDIKQISSELNLSNDEAEEIHTLDDIDAASDFELKHSPNIDVQKTDDGYTVSVSIGLKGIAHPQTVEHLIEWIRIYDDKMALAEFNFSADDTPKASYQFDTLPEILRVRAFCNLHGIWQGIYQS